MAKNQNSHLNRQLSPFNRGWFTPQKMHTQVNGETQLSQDNIRLKRDAVTMYKK